MSIVTSQRRIFLGLAGELRPSWRSAPDLPDRMRRLLSRRREFGARDRRLYRELLYTCLRFLPWVEPELDSDSVRATALVAWLAADTPATRAFRAALTEGWPVCPDRATERASLLGRSAAELLPGWLEAECPAAFRPAELDALHRRAPLWIRLQAGEPAAVIGELAAAGWDARPSGVGTDAWKVSGQGDLTRSGPYRRGEIEIQDLGSQLVLAAVEPTPGERWLDACAGAGGKTLQLARALGPSGTVHAHDIRGEALRELERRVARAGCSNVEVLSGAPVESYDGVLVDAPCSGSGTWRRSPHLKWVTTPADLRRHARRQTELLSHFGPRVRPGGVLVYATCSLCRIENEAVVSRFLENGLEFQPATPARDFDFGAGGAGLTILPSRHDTDGFYLAVLRRRG